MKRAFPGSNPFEAADAIPSFLDPEFDNLEETELDLRDQYRGVNLEDQE